MIHTVLHASQAQPQRFKVYEKGGTLSAVRRMQDVKNPAIASQSLASAGQAVQVAKMALESVAGMKEVL